MFKVTILTTKDGSMKQFDSNQDTPTPVSGMPGLGTMVAVDNTIHTVSAYTLISITATPIAESGIKIDFAKA